MLRPLKNVSGILPESLRTTTQGAAGATAAAGSATTGSTGPITAGSGATRRLRRGHTTGDTPLGDTPLGDTPLGDTPL
ncbi:MAG: hypothetical protein ACK48R_08995, partial [Planctomyces sp.]